MYVHLLSNASLDTFPDNNLGDFSTVLAKPLLLPGSDWEVGLAEIHIPFSIDIIPKKDAQYQWIEYDINKRVLLLSTSDYRELKEHGCSIIRKESHYEVNVPTGLYIQIPKPQGGLPEFIFGNTGHTFYGANTNEDLTENALVHSAHHTVTSYTFSGGFYNDIKLLLEEINERASNFELSMEGDIVKYTPKGTNGVPRFSTRLANVLGFRNRSIQSHNDLAVHGIDPFPGTNSFLVSTDFIEDSHVGDTTVPLLRTLPFLPPTTANTIMSYDCFPAQYKKALQHEINTIRIRITDDSGQEIPFKNRGRVFATLHFRQNGGISSTHKNA